MVFQCFCVLLFNSLTVKWCLQAFRTALKIIPNSGLAPSEFKASVPASRPVNERLGLICDCK